MTKYAPSGEKATHDTLQATELDANFLPRPTGELTPVGVVAGVIPLPFRLTPLLFVSKPLKSQTDTTRSEPTVTRTPSRLETA